MKSALVRGAAIGLLAADAVAFALAADFLWGLASTPSSSFLPVQEYAQLFLWVGAPIAILLVLAFVALLRPRWFSYVTATLLLGAVAAAYAYLVFAESRPLLIAALSISSVILSFTAPLTRSRKTTT